MYNVSLFCVYSTNKAKMIMKIFLSRLFLALLLGAGIGVERQIKQRSAGLITNALVALGACMFILVSEIVAGKGNYDNLRVVAQIVTGVGFLGAGVIMRDGFTIHGLNTAATIWCSAAVGSLCGFGLYAEAAIAAGAVVTAHLTLKPVADFFDRKSAKPQKTIGFSLSIVVNRVDEMKAKTEIVDMISRHNCFNLQKISSSQHAAPDFSEVKIEVKTATTNEQTIKNFIIELSKIEYIKELSSTLITKKTEH